MTEQAVPPRHSSAPWYKDAVIYELHVKAFADSNGDGIGDFRGLTSRLDYLRDLGITAIWLLPFYPSPLRDDGYDIADYFNVRPEYGTLKDFKDFLKKAHERGIRVITELIMNHTSDQHLWFKRSRRAKPGSRWRDYYVWSDTPERYKDARVIFKDFEASNWTWDQQAGAYYWHRFYSHQPDLNFDSRAVERDVSRVVDFWFRLGVDGLRLDAIPYLYEREGTNCENLPETYEFLRRLRAHVDAKFQDRMLLSEANQWPEDAAAYFGTGDMSHMAFHFPLMPRMFIGLQMEDSFPILDILDQTPPIPDSCQWALFLRNHDELTLEMVTDEERDYMYRIYARDPRARINLGIRRRLAPLMRNNRRRIELMNVLLFSLPGTPVIYYGDEIGMGDNYYLGDRDGVRTPMQWSPDRNAGFSKANPQKLYLPVIIDPEYHYESVNVENQQSNTSSLLWWMKRIIAMRRDSRALSRGTLEFLLSENPKVLSFVRSCEGESILVVVNLSRHYQVASLPLVSYAGCEPVEIVSRNRFPRISEERYVLTLAPHSYLWLLLSEETAKGAVADGHAVPVPELELKGATNWERLFDGEPLRLLEHEILPKYVPGCRWFGAKAKTVRRIRVEEAVRLAALSKISYLLFLAVQYVEGGEDINLVPVSFAWTRITEPPGDDYLFEDQRVRIDSDWMTLRASIIGAQFPQSVIAKVRIGENEGILYDAAYDDSFRELFLDMVGSRRRFRGKSGELVAHQGRQFRRLINGSGPDAQRRSMGSHVMKVEQSNTSMIYGDVFYLKLYRTLKEGTNPDREVVQFLTEKTEFPHIPPFAGFIEYRRPNAAPVAIGLLQGFVQAHSDGWSYALSALGRYYEQVLSRLKELEPSVETEQRGGPALLEYSPTATMRELVEAHFLEMVSLLGQRTGELHLALASGHDDPDFEPEPFTMLYQRSVYQSMRGLLKQTFQLLGRAVGSMTQEQAGRAEKLLASEERILDGYGKLLQSKLGGNKIRIHGDYHLGQVLFTGKDFMIIDFEGEPARSLTERRIKRSPLRDVAGMIRSFHYAAYFGLLNEASLRAEDRAALEGWADEWFRNVSSVFLHSYFNTVKDASILPSKRDELELMLRAFLFDKAVYELGYELNNRPTWAIIPLKGLESLLNDT